MPSTDPPSPGLRERKKERTRNALREAAFRLFEKQGYANTTTEQIAAAADVSPSTFFRYFPSKAALVVADDVDPVTIAAFRRLPPDMSVLRALKAAIDQVNESMSAQEWRFEDQRWALLRTEQELRGAQQREVERTVDLLCDLIAERTGRPADDLQVRAMAGALVGAFQAIDVAPAELANFDLVAFLESGMPLDGDPVFAEPGAKRLSARSSRRTS